MDNYNGYSNSDNYFYKGHKKCLNACTDINKYYYDPSNKEFIDTCELTTNKKFYYPIIKGLPECKDSCPDGKFYIH